ncbi:MAG TPA: hypothetical protein VLT84_04650 [Acidobacteriota bacterium]|nr:hypothetical protein [Acidobacteriota bacterium]
MLHSKLESRLLLLSALALSVGFLALGCNREGGQVGSKGNGSKGGAVAARPASTTPAGAASGEATSAIAATNAAAGGVAEPSLEAESTPRGDDTEVTPAEFLPPDVATPVTEMLVTPGSIVEITAEASSDVVAVELSDGISKAIAFRHDEAGGVWRAPYRVPLRLKGERLGLSITAKNGSEKYRRVWVFLKDAKSVASADSSTDR